MPPFPSLAARAFLACVMLAPACAAHAAAASSSGSAEERRPPADVEEIVVEAVRLPSELTEVGTSVSVLTAADIRARGFDFAVDALAAVPGVTVNQNGAFGGQATVRIRGATSGQTLVLIDGIPVNDPASPGGGFDFARLDVANIERIEVLKGPQSTLWGSDAIGGVVSITTQRPQRGLGGTVALEAGSFETRRAAFDVEGGGDRGDFRLGISGFDTDGISKADEDAGNTEDDGFENVSVAGRGGLLLGRARLDASILYTDAEAEFDSFAFGAPGNVADGDEKSEAEEYSGRLSLRVPMLDGRLQHRLVAGRSEIDRRSLAAGTETFSANGERTQLRYQGTLALGGGSRLAVGAEREETETDTDDTRIDGLFALTELELFEALTLSAGLRHDDHDFFGSETTGRLAAAFAASDAWTLRASWAEGFKAPTLFQSTFFCCGAAGPNPDLQPETAEAFDVGAAWRAQNGRARVGLTLFAQDIENQIDFSFAAGGYDNIAEVDSRGVELTAEVVLTRWLRASLDYAFIDAEDGSGEALRRVPRHSGDLFLQVDPGGRFSGGLLVRHNGEEPDGAVDVDDWTRVDLTGRWRLSPTVELTARLENLLDEDYQQIVGYGTPGRSGTVGVRLRW